ncbi:hypothetical protein BCT61_00925 [Vibrio breoganii]|uniref:amidohydrolase family protein n=1 Tax=Vibrio breoganii TaxID=553239 RepID=UPI000C826830|nr:amidohydrolase family protein [Vibrio breoganii]PMM09620.1 hypothetical protein BCT61_00925 [Vibrio breoganii]
MTKQNFSSGDNIPFTTSKASLSLAVPEGSCDCHHHIFDPDNFAYRAEDTTNIPTATVPMYQQLQNEIGFSRNVIVTPSAYGIDNQCTLDAMQQLGDSARAVVTIDDSFSFSQLQEMDRLGVCGIRFMITEFKDLDLDLIQRCAEKIAPLNWHICFWVTADMIVAMKDLLFSLPCDVVFDHRGHLPAGEGVKHPAFEIICQLMNANKAWVKVSAAYHDSESGSPSFADTLAIGKAYIATNPNKILWGTDWPHPSETIAGNVMPDDVHLLNLLSVQTDNDTTLIHKVLVDNPKNLYRF